MRFFHCHPARQVGTSGVLGNMSQDGDTIVQEHLDIRKRDRPGTPIIKYGRSCLQQSGSGILHPAF